MKAKIVECSQIDSFTQNVQWTFGGEGKRTRSSQNFRFIEISSEKYRKKLYPTAFTAVYFVSEKEF